jgi:hypothetical protein
MTMRARDTSKLTIADLEKLIRQIGLHDPVEPRVVFDTLRWARDRIVEGERKIELVRETLASLKDI